MARSWQILILNSFSEVISGAIATGVTDGLRRCGLILIDEQESES